MSMLAEKRVKKRYNLVPRGKPLYEDANNIGKQMLEKMGWSKGKGLGANEDGNKDFVRVKCKQDNIGLGYEDRDDGWTQHKTDFEDLLKSLQNSAENSDNEDQTVAAAGFGFQTNKSTEEKVITKLLSGESLEEKSKKSKARVHYKKFTKGKDISQYSEKDLANIFGKKTFNNQIKSNITINEEKPDECNVSKEYGVTTISSGTTVNDYFKNKLACLKMTKNDDNLVKTMPEDSTLNYSNSGNLLTDNKELTKKSKRKRKNADIDNQEEVHIEKLDSKQDTELEVENKIYESQTSTLVEPLKKKKKKKRDNLDQETAEVTQEYSESPKNIKTTDSQEMNDETNQINSVEAGQNCTKRKNCEDNEEEACDSQERLEDVKVKSKKGRKDKTIDTAEGNSFNEARDKVYENASSGKDIAKSNEVLKIDNTEVHMKKSKRNNQKEIRNVKCNEIDDCKIIRAIKETDTNKSSGSGQNNNEDNKEQDCNSQEILEEVKPRRKKSRKEKANLPIDTAKVDNLVEESDKDNKYAFSDKTNLQFYNDLKSNDTELHMKKSKRNNQKEIRNIEDNNIIGALCKQESTQEENPHEIIEEQKKNSDMPIEYNESANKNKKSKKNTDNPEILVESRSEDNELQIPSTSNNSGNEKSENPPVNKGDTYQISLYCAEQFRNVDMNGFIGSNLGEILGYSMSKDISIQVTHNENDKQSISNMWCRAIDKYNSQVTKETNPKETDPTESHPGKKRKFVIKRFKKKKIFRVV